VKCDGDETRSAPTGEGADEVVPRVDVGQGFLSQIGHGVRNNATMNPGQLMISRLFVPTRLNAATPRHAFGHDATLNS